MTLTTLVWTCLLGAVSALLLLAMVDPGVQLGGLTLDSGLGFVVILWLSAWLLSSWGFTQRTRGLLEVTRRACTVVALECLVLGLWFRAEPLAGAATRGAAMGPASPSAAGNSGLAEQLAGTPATVGLWICLVVWLACRLLSAPPQPRSSSL